MNKAGSKRLATAEHNLHREASREDMQHGKNNHIGGWNGNIIKQGKQITLALKGEK